MFPTDFDLSKIKISTLDANSAEAEAEEKAAHTLGKSLYFDFDKKVVVIVFENY